MKLTFILTDAEGVPNPHDDLVVITINIANYDVNCVLVNNRSSVDVLFNDALLKMNIPLA